MSRSFAVFFPMLVLLTACGADWGGISQKAQPADQIFHSCFSMEDDGGGATRTRASSETYLVPTTRQGFDLKASNGIARIYDRNPNGGRTDIDLELVGDGTLTGSDFITSTGGIPRAHETNHRFLYEPEDVRFAEASLFANATITMNWYKSFGFDTANEQIGIGVHSEIGGSPNNALYIPGSDGEIATIRIGDGDGIFLQNLAVDSDVISHELGHHIVYRKLKVISGESLIIHEGLADFFTMIMNDDPCLAATVCPAGSNTCWRQAQCLRTADNDLKWDDPALPNRATLKGQVLSGMLWDMKQTQLISAEDLTRLVFDAIDFLEVESNIRGLIRALHQSDEKNFGGAHRDLVNEVATGRRLM